MGLTPNQLHEAYALADIAPEGDPQTIGIVAAFDDPTALKDLKTYSKEFHLPFCTAAKHCFEKLNQRGERNSPPSVNGGWAEEISLDIESAHAICKNCHILLVEADSEKLEDLEAAEDVAAEQGATEISNSFAFPEPTVDSPAFDHKGIVITAASGDEGYLNWTGEEHEQGHANYPASSPHVIAVGGTRVDDSTGEWTQEVWNGEHPYGGPGAAGSGCSSQFTAPYWQLELSGWSALGCHAKRAVADISADADPRTGVAIYDSTPNEQGEIPEWREMGGTSLSSPLIAAMFAVAGGSGGVDYPARTLYENALLEPESLEDVDFGSNGSCEGALTGEGRASCSVVDEGRICSESPICVAGSGFDGPSGLGAPKSEDLFKPTGAPPKQTQQVHFAPVAPAGARVGDAPRPLTASASSGLPVGFSSQTPTVCAVEDERVSMLSPGTCTLEAGQRGNSEYAPATPAEQSFTISKGLQTITFTSAPPTSATVAGSPYPVSALASSGLPVEFSSQTSSVCSLEGTTVVFTGPGTCTILASQAGDEDYEAASAVAQSFAVSEAPTLHEVLPGSGTSGTTTGSGTLSFTSTGGAGTPPSNTFKLLGAPRVNHRTGAVTFSVSVSAPGTLTWSVVFRPGRSRVNVTFSSGHVSAKASGTVTFTVVPRASARTALRQAAHKKRSLSLKAVLGFRSALGGTSSAQAFTVADRVG